MNVTFRRITGAGAAMLVVCAIIAGLLWVAGNQSGSDPDPTPGIVACEDVKSNPTFLAYNAKTKGDNFGPSSSATNVEEAQADLHQRRCTDPALVTTHAAYYGVDGLSLPMSQNQFEAATLAALASPDKVWRDRVAAVEAYEASGELSMSTSKARYDTLFFRKGDHKRIVPMLFAGPVSDRISTLFVVRHGNVTKRLKLECGGQPFEPEFPGTPDKPKKPKTPDCIRADVPKPEGYGAGWVFNWYFCKYLCERKNVKNPGDSTWTFNWYFCKWLPPESPGPTPTPTPEPTPKPTPTPEPTPPPPVKPVCPNGQPIPPNGLCPKGPVGSRPSTPASATPNPIGTASAPTRPAPPDAPPLGGVTDVNPPAVPAQPDSGSGATNTVAPSNVPVAPSAPAPAPSGTASGIVGSD